MTRLAAFSTFLLGTLLIAAAPAQADKLYKIGCALPLSGPEVGFGTPVHEGMQLAVDEFNAAHKLPGVTVQLDCQDSQDQAQQTVSIAQNFVDDPAVVAALSDFSSTATMAAANTYARAGLVDMTPTASSPKITKLNPWMFRASEIIPTYIDPLADFAVKTLGKKSIAIMQVQTDWGEGVAKTFTTRVTEDGGKIIDTEVYNPGTTDFRAQLTALRRLHPDVIFLAMLEQDAAIFMQQRQEFGMNDITVIDSGVGVTARSMKLAGPAFDGLWAAKLFNPDSKLPQVQSFITAFTAKYHETPDQWSADGYDAATLILRAIQRAAPDVTRTAVRDQLLKTGEYFGANGELTIDPVTREIGRSAIPVVRVEHGAIDYNPKS
jgi:branched-chain amino acid transport system substrate-binding protein